MNVSYGDAYVHECIQMYTHMNTYSMHMYINVYTYGYECKGMYHMEMHMYMNVYRCIHI